MPPWLSFLIRGRNQATKSAPTLKQVGDYKLVKTIGRGSSGHVKLGIHIVTGEYVAIKMIPRRHLLSSVTMARSVERELAILQLIHHPHLIDLKQVLQDANYVYFVTEYAQGGELYHALAGRGRLPEQEAKHFFGQVAIALAWCHAHRICHRDLKPENILLDKTRTKIKIADFGMAIMQPPESLLRTSCGSPHYASPEIVAGKPYYGPAADVWSCGILLFVLLAGYFPFDDEHVPRLLMKIKSGRRRKIPGSVSSSAKDLIRRMLTVDPADRITMDQILQHPWLEELEKTVHIDELPLLQDPVISEVSQLDGRTWETLKVLWRDQGQHKIVTALLSKGENIQKLTFHLLQQRTRRMLAQFSGENKEVRTNNDNKMATAASALHRQSLSVSSSNDHFSTFSSLPKTHSAETSPASSLSHETDCAAASAAAAAAAVGATAGSNAVPETASKKNKHMPVRVNRLPPFLGYLATDHLLLKTAIAQTVVTENTVAAHNARRLSSVVEATIMPLKRTPMATTAAATGYSHYQHTLLSTTNNSLLSNVQRQFSVEQERQERASSCSASSWTTADAGDVITAPSKLYR